MHLNYLFNHLNDFTWQKLFYQQNIPSVTKNISWRQGCRFVFDIGGDLNQQHQHQRAGCLKGIVQQKNENSVIYSPSSSSKPVWMCLFWTQRKIFWRMWETEQFWGIIDFYRIVVLLWKSMVPQNNLITNFLQNIFLCVQHNKDIHTNLELHFWANYPFNHTSLCLNINLIGPRMILKEYSAVVVVTKIVCVSDWQINCTILYQCCFFILWIFQLTVWFVRSVEQHSFKVKDCPRRLRMLFQILLHHRVPLSLPKKNNKSLSNDYQIIIIKIQIILVPNYCWCSSLYPERLCIFPHNVCLSGCML